MKTFEPTETFDIQDVINCLKNIGRPAAKVFLESEDADTIRIAIANHYESPVCVDWILDAMFKEEIDLDLSCNAEFQVEVRKTKYDYVDICITGTIDDRHGSIRGTNVARSDIKWTDKHSIIKAMITKEYVDWIGDTIDKQQQKED